MRKSSSSTLPGDLSKRHYPRPTEIGASSSESSESSAKMSLSRLGRDILLRRDIFGRNILHICILCNSVDELRQLLQNSNIRAILPATDYENGWNIFHYIFYYKRLKCLQAVLAFFEQNQGANASLCTELLRRKDRSKAVPLSLLGNDIKDFYWVPHYINEHNEFHLVRRFSASSSGSTNEHATNASSMENNVVTAISVSTNEQQGSVGSSEGTNSSANPDIAFFPRHVDHDWWSNSRGGSDVYVFGANSNNNLGLGDSADRSTPTRVDPHDFGDSELFPCTDLRDFLHTPRYKFVRISKYHSAVCTVDGRLFTCGIGARGRLGHGNALSLYKFKQVMEFNNSCTVVDCAISNNHNLVLASSGKLFAWGQNIYNQLGFNSTMQNSFKNNLGDVYENFPQEILTGEFRRAMPQILGVAVSRVHSLAFSSNSLYFWGLNIGQVGLDSSDNSVEHRVNGKCYKGSIVPHPKEIQMRDRIRLVTTCDTCTCVVTETNDIHLFYLGQRVRLAKVPARVDSSQQFDSFKPSALTRAPVIKKIAMKSHEHVHILLDNGDVLGFGINADDLKVLRNVKYSLLWSASDKNMRAVDIDNSYDGSLIVCTKNGSVLVRSNSANISSRRGSSTTLAAFSSTTKKKFRKLEGVNRVVKITCDDSFSSFGLIKDDVDSLPFKLQKNDFFKDMKYLSPLVEPNSFRKQDQLLDVDHDLNCYITDYLYPKEYLDTMADDKLLLLGSLSKDVLNKGEPSLPKASHDFLRKAHLNKTSSKHNVEPGLDAIYQKHDEADIASHVSLLRANVFPSSTKPSFDWSCHKFYDGKFIFAKLPGYFIGFHTQIFKHRSKLCQDIFQPKEDGEFFTHNGIQGSYDVNSRTIIFETDVHPISVLVLVHFVYTNIFLNFWDGYSPADNTSDIIRKIRTDVTDLMTLFKMDLLFGKDQQYLSQMQEMLLDEGGDVTLSLANGESTCCSSLLVARSAFFETILSGRWETGQRDDTLEEDAFEPKFIGMENITMLQMSIILKHLYGCNDLDVFAAAKRIVADSDDFVNFLLEMVEVADELLLVQLKHLCELAIKDFIKVDNVVVLLGHADWLNAKKLFMSCCWYIYNNLEVVLFDPDLLDLGDNILDQVEFQLQFLDQCKHSTFAHGVHDNFHVEKLLQCPGFYTTELVDTYVTNFNGFNELFMSDAKGFLSFEPLVDVKIDTLSSSDEARRKPGSRKMSRKGSAEVAADIQKLIISSMPSNRKGSDSAIADDEEFELVVSRKRKSKPYLKEERNSVSSKSNESSRSADKDDDTGGDGRTNFSSSPSPSMMEMTSSSENSGWNNSASTATGLTQSLRQGSVSATVKMTPILGESAEKTKRPTKIKFAPSMKLSQRERRKLGLQGDNESSSSITSDTRRAQVEVDVRNPWKVPNETSTRGSSATSSSENLSNLPVLGQKVESKRKPSSSIDTASSETIRIGTRPEVHTKKTLQEIQQEQEFARWWEEESKRVQQALEGAARDVTNKGRTVGGRGGRSGRRGRRRQADGAG